MKPIHRKLGHRCGKCLIDPVPTIRTASQRGRKRTCSPVEFSRRILTRTKESMQAAHIKEHQARTEDPYAAFLDPTALIDRLPPAETTGKIHKSDARLGADIGAAVLPAG